MTCMRGNREKAPHMEKENLRLAESLLFHEHRAISAHGRLRVIWREQAEHIGASILPGPTDSNDEMECMVLSEAAKTWLKQHSLEGFLWIVEAPPHGEARESGEGDRHKPHHKGGHPSLDELTRRGNILDRQPFAGVTDEVYRRVLIRQQGVPYARRRKPIVLGNCSGTPRVWSCMPRSPAMPRNRVGLIIATYEGVQVDWPVIITDGLSVAIILVKDGKKIWTTVVQWLILLAPPVDPSGGDHQNQPPKQLQNGNNSWLPRQSVGRRLTLHNR